KIYFNYSQSYLIEKRNGSVKKLFFGSLLLVVGIIGVLVIIVLSVNSPWSYNGIDGFLGFLLGSETITFFVLFAVMSVAGVVICFYEAYIRELA
ncbi:hypothetical protein ACERII_06115, partial [Evansella sp. AB-rgal1]|uniref:hypothetical protein n=1 Tax=Evansella sp. AB-rgal1 TaxID=3242696 RepID=UPI00359CEBD3